MAGTLWLVTLLSAGCFDVEMDLVVRDDGSGSLTSSIRVAEVVVEFAAAADGTPEEVCEQFANDQDAFGPLGGTLDVLDVTVETPIEAGECVVAATGA